MPETLTSNFTSVGLTCSGTLILPDAPRPPVVVMAHGFAAEKAFLLPEYAERFVAAGFAVFLFDYRNFGTSEGEPRNWVSPGRHLEDWRAALRHVRSLNTIDSGRIAIWGSSLSGGHVLQIASEDSHIAAVVSQVPHVDGVATAMRKHPREQLQATIAALRDIVQSKLTGKPYYSPVIAKPGVFAALNTPECWDGFQALLPADTTWENKVLSRVFLEMPLYSPTRSAKKIQAPTLIVVARDDTVTPPGPAKKAAAKIRNAELLVLDCNHFAAYSGEPFKKNVAAQVAFLTKRLRPARAWRQAEK